MNKISSKLIQNSKFRMNLKMKSFLPFVFCLLPLIFTSCYTLSGSSIDPTWQTIKIATFPNVAPQYQNPNLSQEFTNKLQDIFNNRTKLSLTADDNADLLIEGEITGYQQSAVAIQANEIAGKNRLTMTVRVRYQNNKDESKSFDKSFSAYEDFEANQTIMQAESALLPDIIEQLTAQIFNAIAMDW
ncbi:Lipopolysaccharide-assembly [Moheibacter sediminis]|uniref:Lipopolysaccharide-assembly n=2 Tax=Moheibacter sediminis TaxID=1434700 RepID=A0A1W1ZT88_9FLAO|nr:Lipopolysaccharide-assembly [Moheibacter sediminis]